MFAIVLNDLRRQAPHVAPTLRHWDAAEARSMVKPSLFFGLAVFNNFLLFEVPLLILQRTVGPLAVVTFATTRTLFSAGRQLLGSVQVALIPEITRSFATGQTQNLSRLYRLSGELAFIGGLALNATLALASDVILDFWLHGRITPPTRFIALMAVVSLATMYRDSKYFFQLATNRHEKNIAVMFLSYTGLALLGWALSRVFQETGIALAWLASELVIILSVLRENRGLIRQVHVCSPVYYFAGLAAFYFLLLFGLNSFATASKTIQALAAGAAGMLVAAIGLATMGRGIWPLAIRLSNQFLCRRKRLVQS